MIPRTSILIALAVALCVPAVAEAQQLSPQQKLMARRAAELDAYRKITETVKGLQISSKTTVKDFVTENDQIQTAFVHFIKGIRIVGDAVYNDDGTVEVQAAVTVAQVIRELKRMRRKSYIGGGWVEEEFNKIRTFVKKKVITATGYGAPPEPKKVNEDPDFTGKNVPPPAEEPEREPTRPRRVYKPSPTAGLPGWEGVTGQGRLAALRAAQTDAYAKLAETINGVRLSSKTLVKDFVTEKDEIKSELNAFIKGIKELGPPVYHEDGTVEVHYGVTLAQLVEQIKRTVKRVYQGNSYQDIEYKKISTFTKTKLIQASGLGAPPKKYVLKGMRFIGWDALRGPAAAVKLNAIRGTNLAAARRFAERTAGLQILRGTYVRDMVAESDVIMARTAAYLKGLEAVGDIVFYSDGVVESKMGATWKQVIKQVSSLIKTDGMGTQELLRRIRIFEKKTFFAETGQAALPSTPRYWVGGATPPPPPAKNPEWTVKTIKATGYGAPRAGASGPQGKLLAQRAARLDALRKLSEQVYGLELRSNTTVRDFVTENDTIESATAAFIRGAKEVDVKENDDGTWEVTIEVPLDGLYKLLAKHL